MAPGKKPGARKPNRTSTLLENVRVLTMSKNQTPILAWHYTLGANLLRILESGYILPFDREDTPVVELPVAWFSVNQRFEPSAAKRLEVNGVAQAPTLAMMRQFGNGVYRLGMAPRQLLGGEALRRQARINKERWRELSKTAQECGADVSDWFGAVDPVAASDCVIEVLTEDMQWARVAS